MDKGDTAFVFILVFLLFGFGMVVGATVSTARQRKQAVEAGAGQYVTDSKTGATTFVYGSVK